MEIQSNHGSRMGGPSATLSCSLTCDDGPVALPKGACVSQASHGHWPPDSPCLPATRIALFPVVLSTQILGTSLHKFSGLPTEAPRPSDAYPLARIHLHPQGLLLVFPGMVNLLWPGQPSRLVHCFMGCKRFPIRSDPQPQCRGVPSQGRPSLTTLTQF